MLMLISISGLLIGLWLFSSFREHLLTSLLSLEFMALMLFLLFFIILNFYGLYYSLIYLVMAACEGALGLSILVRMGRTHGGDYFKSINLYIN